MRKQFEQRFWEKVDKSAGTEACWIWTGARTHNGYGVTTIEKNPMGAHRASFVLANGTIPPGMVVCHTCDNPPCVNPSHLFVGTHLDNMRDAKEKGHMENNYRREDVPEFAIARRIPRMEQNRNRPQLVATVDSTTKSFVEWVRCQWGLDNNGHALDYIITAILSGRQFDTSEFTDDSGQVTEAFATALMLFVGFIAFGGMAFIASAAYIQPALRALGIH